MEKVYSAPNGALVYLLKSILKDHGIKSVVRGEHLASIAGGVAPIEAWVELWTNEEDAKRAREVLASHRTQ